MSAAFSDINSPRQEMKYRRGLRRRLNALLRHPRLKRDAVVSFIADHQELQIDANAGNMVEAFASGVTTKLGLRELMAIRERVNAITRLLDPRCAVAPKPEFFV